MGTDDIRGYGNCSLDSFEFEYGKILQNVAVEYSVRGNPKYDEDGNIINAIIFCHNFYGNYSAIDDFHELTCEGGPLDKNDYCFISITSLGFPNSCSPSSTELKHNFPKYTIKDRVNFKRQFLKEKFNIEKVLGIFGYEMGGYEAYTWACEYPDEMEFIIVIGSSFKTSGYKYIVAKGFDGLIESSDDFYKDLYSDSLSRIMVSINRFLYSYYFPKKLFQAMSNHEIDVLMEDFVDDGLFMDVYDFKYSNDAILEYNLESKLSNIKAKSLIISCTDDLYYSPEFDTIPVKDLIEGSKIILFESKRDLLDEEDYAVLIGDFESFLEEFKK